ncbi:redoxin domain-containing protein [Maribacter chungangensis]|uniref:Redoxin domain-containing protein n=1 Tax=Maribacter chungangensis TaxID=1069117 RepID=A0ABW3B371_9FLAO
MKHSLFLLIVLVMAVSCNQNPDGFLIKGELRGDFEEGTQVFLKKTGDNGQPMELDTTIVVDGKFEFSGTTTEPDIHYIFVDKLPGYTAIIVEDGTINFNAQKDSLGFAKVDGTLQNEIFFSYLDKSKELSQQARSIQEDMQRASSVQGNEATVMALNDEMQELQDEYKTFEMDFIKNNPNGLISALLLDRAISMNTVTVEEIQAMYDALTPEIKETKPGKKVLDLIAQKKKAEEASKSTAIGAKAPEFSGPNPDGEIVALSDIMGKVTLIDFWAAWCRPCRAENPNIVAVYEKYHDKGLNVIGVSLDRTAEAWKKAIKDDGLDWHQISNIAYFDDQIAKMYNVNAIPAAFLLDENGIIVAKNLRGPQLEAKVSELLD